MRASRTGEAAARAARERMAMKLFIVLVKWWRLVKRGCLSVVVVSELETSGC